MGTALLWLRRDLRLTDNPALLQALQACERVIPVYLHDPDEAWAPGAASQWWLHHSLQAALGERGSRLILRRGPALEGLRGLAREAGASHVYWNRLYEPAALARDRAVSKALRADGMTVHSRNAALLFEPWALSRADGGPYRRFTPFWKACGARVLSAGPSPAPRRLPTGEAGARERLQAFLDGALAGYPENRDRPGLAGGAGLSPHLHFGEIGPRQLFAAVHAALAGERASDGAEAFLRQLGWREFAHHLLFHFPQTPERPLDARFESFPWAQSHEAPLDAWRQGRTGIPIVDAGMRELRQTGWMHNRVRMIAASLLTKNLLVPWQADAAWFWDTLVDADLANNTLGWQWTAGCGADAAPYFRIFNPVLQGRRHDPRGEYVRRWVPELAALPDAFLHRPWEAGARVLAQAGVVLDRDYPTPVVELRGSRRRALERYQRISRHRAPTSRRI